MASEEDKKESHIVSVWCLLWHDTCIFCTLWCVCIVCFNGLFDSVQLNSDMECWKRLNLLIYQFSAFMKH